MIESLADRRMLVESAGREILLSGQPAFGVFDRSFFSADAGGVGIESSMPSLLAVDEDVVAVAHGSAIVIDAVTYHVVNIQPDGTGFTRLLLEKR